jgi:hypothetical protein
LRNLTEEPIDINTDYSLSIIIPENYLGIIGNRRGEGKMWDYRHADPYAIVMRRTLSRSSCFVILFNRITASHVRVKQQSRNAFLARAPRPMVYHATTEGSPPANRPGTHQGRRKTLLQLLLAATVANLSLIADHTGEACTKND